MKELEKKYSKNNSVFFKYFELNNDITNSFSQIYSFFSKKVKKIQPSIYKRIDELIQQIYLHFRTLFIYFRNRNSSFKLKEKLKTEAFLSYLNKIQRMLEYLDKNELTEILEMVDVYLNN